MRPFFLKPSQIRMTAVRLVAILSFLAACGNLPTENPQAVSTALTNSGKVDFVNEQLSAENPLFIPPLLAPRLENGEMVFDLVIREGRTEIFPGQRTETLGFNGNILGPTIRAHTHDKVRLNVTNQLSAPTTTHWHGMKLPAAMDGGPHQMIQPGETWQSYWTIGNEAATLWYHPHLMGMTGEQVYRGLAGFFIIDNENSDSLDIPKQYGVDDIPLVIQDREFDRNAQLVYRHEQQASNFLLPLTGRQSLNFGLDHFVRCRFGLFAYFTKRIGKQVLQILCINKVNPNMAQKPPNPELFVRVSLRC